MMQWSGARRCAGIQTPCGCTSTQQRERNWPVWQGRGHGCSHPVGRGTVHASSHFMQPWPACSATDNGIQRSNTRLQIPRRHPSNQRTNNEVCKSLTSRRKSLSLCSTRHVESGWSEYVIKIARTYLTRLVSGLPELAWHNSSHVWLPQANWRPHGTPHE